MCLLDLLPGLFTGSGWKRSGCRASLVTFCLFNKVVFPCWWNAWCRLQRSPVSRTAALSTQQALFLLQPSSVLLSPSCSARVSPPLYSISLTAAAARLKCHLTVWEDKDYDGFQIKGNLKKKKKQNIGTLYWADLHVYSQQSSVIKREVKIVWETDRGIKFNLMSL